MCPAPMSMLAGLHLYPKTPKDLTVTTRLGGTVSLIGLVVMGFLFATELRAYMVPSLETSIELDDNAEKKLLISFNISLPHVPCHVASVDVKDVLGTRIANVTQNVFKRRSVLKVPWIRGPCSVPGSQLGARAGIRRSGGPPTRLLVGACEESHHRLVPSRGCGGALARAQALAGVTAAAFGRPGTSSMRTGGSARWWAARCRSRPRGSG